MFHVKHLPSSELFVVLDERLDQYRQVVHTYHQTLDLVSDVALARLPDLIDQAQAYAEVIAEVASSGTILDLGSGAGLPGVVIAAALPHRDVLLVERRRRRVAFLRIVLSKLALRRARVIEADVRDLARPDLDLLLVVAGEGERTVDPPAASPPGTEQIGLENGQAQPLRAVRVVTAQAVGEFAAVYRLTRHLHADEVTLVSRKGDEWQAEVDRLAAGLQRAPAVRAARTLPDGGSLIAVEMPGGLPCPRLG